MLPPAAAELFRKGSCLMIQSVDRALDILTIVANGKGEPVPLRQISEKTGLNKSACFHLIETMAERGFLRQVSQSKGYVLGASTFYLTRYRTFHQELLQISNPILRWIHRQSGYTALLAILENHEKFVISYSEQDGGKFHERGDLFLGNIYASATGRVLLSHMAPAAVAELAGSIGLPDERSWSGIDTLPKLLQELDAVEKLSCLRVDEISPEGFGESKYATYITNQRGVGAAIGLFIPRVPGDCVTQQENRRVIDILQKGTREINHRLRFEA